MSNSDDDSNSDLIVPLQEVYRSQACKFLRTKKVRLTPPFQHHLITALSHPTSSPEIATNKSQPKNFFWEEDDTAYIQNFMLERQFFNVANRKPFIELCKAFGLTLAKTRQYGEKDDYDKDGDDDEEKRINAYILDKLKIKIHTIATNLVKKGKIVATRSPSRNRSRYKDVRDSKKVVMSNLAAALEASERYLSTSRSFVEGWLADTEDME